MVTRTKLVADILSRQQQQRRKQPIFSVGQGVAGLGSDLITALSQGKAVDEQQEQKTAANEAIARALQTATGGVPAFNNPDDPNQQLVPQVQGGTPQALSAALTGLGGPGTEDFRNQLGSLAINQQFDQRSQEAEFANKLEIARQRASSGVDTPASIREFDTLIDIADLSEEETVKAARIRLKLEAGEGVSTPEDRLFFAQIQSKLKVGEASQLSQVKREEGFIDNAFSAAGELPDINRASELIELVSTGGFEAAKTAFTDFFGTTPGDVGELRRILAQNVLNGLAVFTGAISEGEREFLSSITTSIEQGGEVNKRNLLRLRRIANNSINNGKRILERRAKDGDENAINALADFNAVLDQGTPTQGTPTGRFNANGEQLFEMPDGSFVAR